MSDHRKTTLSRPDAVNVAHIVEHCHVLGPGDRFAVWVQGCPIHCPGCHNPQFLPFVDATWLGVESLAERIIYTAGIEGVTFVGGEPFAQPRALAEIAGRVRKSGLTVMVYSGYTFEELTSGKVADAECLMNNADLLMDGRYQVDLPTQRLWRGSENQRLIALSQRYADRVQEWDRTLGQAFEVHVKADGTIEVLGIPPRELMTSI